MALPPEVATADPPRRRFALIDLMILVAATAAGLAVVRWSVPGMVTEVRDVGRGGLLRVEIIRVLMGVLGAWPLEAMWSIAVLAIWLRSARTRRRVLARRPGFVALMASTLGGVFGAAFFVPFSYSSAAEEGSLIAAFPIGYAVAGSWATLICGGRWRPARCPFDRIGRLIGLYWIAMIVVEGWVMATLF